MEFRLQWTHFRDILKTVTDAVVLVSGLAAGICLVYLVGWGAQAAYGELAIAAVHVLIWFFLLSYPARVLLQRRPWVYLRGHLLEFGLVLLIVWFIFFEESLLQEDIWRGGASRISAWPLAYLMLTQVSVLGVMILSVLRINARVSALALSPSWILMLSFLLMIATGTVLLKMPEATTAPGISWLDSLFTATSAVCVTGLIVVDTATQFTFTGQVIILFLFQVGGLGIMTFTFFFAHHLAGGISLRDRVVLADFLNDKSLGRVTSMLSLILGATITFELVGFGLIYAFSDAASAAEADRPLWFVSLFHAVSAFCNAGFSVFTESLAAPATRNNVPVQATVAGLIILGGIGYAVLRDLSNWTRTWTGIWIFRRRVPRPKISLHTRLVLWTTAALLLAGTGVVWVLEYGLRDGLSYTPTWFTAFFNAVTARTAGFNTVPMDTVGVGAAFIIIVLMFIGGSPGGTSGGVKTTTFAVGTLNVIRILRNGRDVQVGNRRISERTSNRAFAVLFLGGAWIFVAFTTVMILEPELAPIDVFFETVSAFGTVGLSRGITADLGSLSRVVIILTMFAGRVGILVFFLAFLPRRRDSSVRFAEEGVILN